MTESKRVKIGPTELKESFRNGARFFHMGAYYDDISLKISGLDICRYTVERIERHMPEGRRLLEPLLDDPNPGVQVFAAGYLAQIFPERAIALLEHIKDYCETEASFTAFHFIQMHRDGMLELGTPEVEPRDDDMRDKDAVTDWYR